jgi:nitrous oxidase accessory protein
MRGDGIRLWEATHVEVTDNELVDVRDLVVWYSSDDVVARNRVTGSRYGTHLMHGDHLRVEDNVYEDDVVGVFVMYSEDVDLVGNRVMGADGEAGVGLGFKESDAIRVTDNVLLADTTGIYLDGTPHRLGGEAAFTGNLIGACEIGLRLHAPSPDARFEGNTFDGNRLAATIDGGRADGRPTFEGNAWSDYAGYDLDGDGFGDVPFEARSVTGTLVEKKPALAWFSGTPAAGLLELFADAFPMFAPLPVLTDARPALEIQ